MENTLVTALIIGLLVILLFTWLSAIPWRATDDFGPEGIQVISCPSDAKFEIVAVHGLDSHPHRTWRGRLSEPKAVQNHLLRDLLKKDYPEARIIEFTYRSKWLLDSIVTSPQKIGQQLLKELRQHHTNLPIIFIGHSFGGIVIKEALCISGKDDEITHSTCGVIFLGTPHQGSSPSRIAAVTAFLTQPFGSSLHLVNGLSAHSFRLTDLEERFRKWLYMRANHTGEVKIIAVRETKHEMLFGLLSLGLVVDQDSAMGYAVNCEDWHCTHRELNKFDSASDTRYVKLKSYINSMREPSALDKAYDIIRADCYDHERLMINRLSGDEISLENCYINLDLIELNSYRSHNDRNGGNGGSGHAVRRPRWFSSLTGFEIREPTSDRQITLVDLFDARRTDNNLLIEPRKILIKGSAGVGKSTLCKKIVYEHTHLKRWNNIFDRVLWIPLRRMQASSNNPVLREMLKQEFFSHRTDSDSLATDLLNGLDGDSFGRTLFLLDGLDEVHQSLNRDNTLHTLLRALISKPNVVITTRPHIVVPSSFVSIDMELKVVGFTLKQVSEYIGITESEHAKEIHEFLARNKIVRDLARIPVQLDALCYTWDEGWKEKKQPKTMTGLYRAIEAKLWRKDFKRRDTKGLEESDSMSDREIAKRAARSGNDAQFVELVAFAGICLQVYEFDSNFCDDLLEQQDLAFPPDGESLAMRLNGLSFIRSSDRSAAAKHQTYHFIHLTYQEYFAARYFARQWTRGESHLWIYNERVEVFKFIHKVKYAPSHDIFWRFVIGLLDDKARERLFDPLSQHPDLTSLMHQSLVMNCMTEVEDMSVLKKELDENLSDWLRNFKASFDGLSLFEFGIGDADVTEGRLWTKPWALETPRTVSETLSGTYSTSPVLKAVYQRIDHDDKLVREMVTFILSQHDNLPESIIEAAMGRLGDIDEDTRSSVLKILKRQRSLSKHQLETTVSLLFNEQRGIRLAAADLVSSLAIDGCFRDRQLSFDFQRLYDLREDPEQSIRRASISLLTGIQEPTDEALCHILIPFQSDDTSTRHFLKSSLSHLVSLTADRLQSLLSQLPCDHPRIRFWAVEILRNQKDLSPSFLRSIADLIVDRDVSMDAVFVIASLASLPEELVEALTTIIQGVDQAWVDVFLRHVCSYEWARQTSMAFLRAILPMIGDNNEWTRSLICQILQLRGELPPDILNSVTTYLQSPTGAHESLIGVFAGLDPLPDAVLQILVELLHFDVTQGVKLQVANVLGKRKFLPAPIMQCLDSFLRDVESDVNIIGIIAISGLEELPDSTRCLLLNLLHHGNEKVKLIICHYIGGRETLFAIQVLEALLTDGHVRIRLAASKMCKEFHSTSVVTSKLMLTPLVALTKHDLQEIRIQATNTLISWPSSASRTKALTERFEVDCKMAQIHAIRGLRNFTPWNQTLLETLTTKLLDCTPGNLRVRQAILQALEASGDRALPEEIVDAISTLIIDNRWKTQETISTIAAIILRRQHRLADSVIRTITETFQNSSQKKTYPAALESLTGQKSLPEETLEIIARLLHDPDLRLRATRLFLALEILPTSALEVMLSEADEACQDVIHPHILEYFNTPTMTHILNHRQCLTFLLRFAWGHGLKSGVCLFFMDTNRIMIRTNDSLRCVVYLQDPNMFQEVAKQVKGEKILQARETARFKLLPAFEF